MNRGRLWHFALAVLLAAGTTTGVRAGDPAPLIPLRLKTVGPVSTSAGISRFQWPAISFEARFKGPAIYLGALTGRARFNLTIDGRPLGRIEGPMPGRWLHDLGPGEHLLRLTRFDEERDIPASFAGLFVARAADALQPPPPRPRQIEFIGDSFLAGFGLSSGKQTCSEEEIWATTDTSQTWAALLADRLNADAEVLAYSCIGLVRNCWMRPDKPTMTQLYGRALFDDPAPAAPQPGWHPHLIVVALGGNDFTDPIRKTEPWRDLAAVKDAFVEEAIRFTRRLRAANPQAFILLLDYDDAVTSPLHARAIQRLNAAGDKRVASASLTGPFALGGCFQHLDAADNRRIAEGVGQWLQAHGLR